MTSTLEAPPAPAPEQPVAAERWRPGRGGVLAAILVGWIVVAAIFRAVAPDRWTLRLAPADLTWLHRWFNDVNDWIGLNRNTSPVFTYFFNVIRNVVDHLVILFQNLISQPSFGRPVPAIGWLGVVALVTLIAAVVANLRVALLALVGLVFIGLQGLWTESMDTLALTLAAVLLSLVIGIPLGILAGVNDRFNAVMEPILDFLQTLPSFVYLAPLTLFFLIGPASATITTLLFAVPPTIRYTAYGIRSVPPTAIEAATSLGSTPGQRLTTVLLPMARRTIVLGVNQTIMAALAMVTITSLIDAPGLGKTILKALQTLDVGTAFNAGLAIVVLAIVLDRITTAAGERVRATTRSNRPAWMRRAVLGAGAVATLFAVYLSRTYLWAAEFPDSLGSGPGRTDIQIGSDIARVAGDATTWIQLHLVDVTNGIKDVVTAWVISPLQTLLVDSPWFLVAAVMLGLALVVAGWSAALTVAICLGLIIATGLWQDAMTTLASTLVATVVVVALGIVSGVAMARNRRVDLVLRPILDAAQVMPPFVYLVPAVALFAASRFSAIVAAVVYAAPVAIKIVADGVAAVSPTAIDAATVAGSNSWQTITKVQLPMAARSLVLATNQGLCYVLAMVVVGGLVGAGALGYDVIAGFSQGQLFGKGLAAGLAIVLLGVMLNRVTFAAAERVRTG